MNHLVMLTKTEDKELISNPVWCFVHTEDTPRTLCGGDAIDPNSRATFKTKSVNSGGITCKDCLSIIKFYKSVKL